MDSSSALSGLARVSGLLLSEHDPVDVINAGLAEACARSEADAAGVLVAGEDGLDVLAATSHRVADLETYQAAAQSGPCVEALSSGTPLVVRSAEEADRRWPGFGKRMAGAGYQRAYAVPMVWQGTSVGGLNVFWREAGAVARDDEVGLQAFADILTIALVHVRPLELGEALERLRDALATRTVVEQAKGVLAFQRDLDMEQAYVDLLAIAEQQHLGLRAAARLVVSSAADGRAW